MVEKIDMKGYDLYDLMEEMQELKEKLRTYCHHQECEQIDECPENHLLCKNQLDLDTAIAWITSCLLDKTLMALETWVENPSCAKSAAKSCFHHFLRIGALASAVSFHKDNYSELFKMILKAREVCHNSFRLIKQT